MQRTVEMLFLSHILPMFVANLLSILRFMHEAKSLIANSALLVSSICVCSSIQMGCCSELLDSTPDSEIGAADELQMA
jgi:hypothetical protein